MNIASAAEPAPLDLENYSSEKLIVDQSSIEVTDGNASMSLTLPGKPAELATPDLSGVPETLIAHATEPALTTETKEASISSFETPNGSQTLISIESAEASHTYNFPFEAPSGSVSQLEKDGSVSFINDEGEYVGGISEPWAYDANGKQLETSFSLSNGILTQTVEFDEHTAFPVVADPNTVWGWTVCVATVGANLMPWGAAAKVGYKLVKRFGSVKKGVNIIWRAYHSKKGATAKRNAAVAVAGGLFAELIGINDIKQNCFS
ncbi:MULTISPECIES: hypothetical protein [Glutamicibacter]|nr:hypothetical protein [Glutamicibacter arilaitensis]CBT77149.1 hypothetical protein AARI_29520 [Glutamicibacter arilaitensis Re117]